VTDTSQEWLTGVIDTGDEKYFTSLQWNGSYSEPLKGHSNRIWFVVQFKDPTETGFHVAAEGGYLDQLGQSLVTASEGTAIRVGSVTSKGLKQFYYYSKDLTWLPEFESRLRSTEERPFGLKVEQDAEWTTYHQILADALQADSDRKVLMELDKNGADLGLPHKTDWYIYFPSEELARVAEIVLLEHDYRVEVKPAMEESPGEWCMVSTLDVVLSFGYIAHMSAMFSSFADDNGGNYDGWGADIAPLRIDS
jgi:hypothetical protein